MPNQTNVFGTRPAEYNDRWRFFFIRNAMKLGMKNPYEEEKIVFSPEYLKKKAIDIRAIRSRYEHYIREMRCLTGDLEALWLNDIQSSFIAELGSMHQSLQDFSSLTEEYASFLDNTAEELSSNPIELEKLAKLPEDNDDPVHIVLSHVLKQKHDRDAQKTDESFAIPVTMKYKPDNGFLYYLCKPLSIVGIKNPFDTQKVPLSAQSIKNRALEMRSILSQLDYNVQKIHYITDEMERMWENSIQSDYFEQFDDLRRMVKDFSNLTEEYASLLDLAAQELETKTTDLDKASVLSNGSEGPVTVVLSNIPYLKRSRIDLKAYDPYYERTQTGVSTEIVTSRKNAEYLYNVYNDHIELIKYIGLKRTVEIPDEIDGLPVTHIGFDCFAMAWRVKFVSVTIPDSVTTIYHGAFRGCQTIRELKLSKNLRYIGNYAFAFLTDLEKLELPENIVSFGMGAFRNCMNLKSVSIPKSTLLRIGNDCFYGCQSMEKVDIGDDVIDIEDWAFKSCEHLNTVAMGENVINIGESAFYNCIRLMRLDVPQTVENIGEAAFYSRRGITLGVTPGSAAEKYAIEHKLQFVTV